jgi:hypothetical protein
MKIWEEKTLNNEVEGLEKEQLKDTLLESASEFIPPSLRPDEIAQYLSGLFSHIATSATAADTDDDSLPPSARHAPAKREEPGSGAALAAALAPRALTPDSSSMILEDGDATPRPLPPPMGRRGSITSTTGGPPRHERRPSIPHFTAQRQHALMASHLSGSSSASPPPGSAQTAAPGNGPRGSPPDSAGRSRSAMGGSSSRPGSGASVTSGTARPGSASGSRTTPHAALQKPLVYPKGRIFFSSDRGPLSLKNSLPLTEELQLPPGADPTTLPRSPARPFDDPNASPPLGSPRLLNADGTIMERDDSHGVDDVDPEILAEREIARLQSIEDERVRLQRLDTAGAMMPVFESSLFPGPVPLAANDKGNKSPTPFKPLDQITPFVFHPSPDPPEHELSPSPDASIGGNKKKKKRLKKARSSSKERSSSTTPTNATLGVPGRRGRSPSPLPAPSPINRSRAPTPSTPGSTKNSQSTNKPKTLNKRSSSRATGNIGGNMAAGVTELVPRSPLVPPSENWRESLAKRQTDEQTSTASPPPPSPALVDVDGRPKTAASTASRTRSGKRRSRKKGRDSTDSHDILEEFKGIRPLTAEELAAEAAAEAARQAAGGAANGGKARDQAGSASDKRSGEIHLKIVE